MSQVSQYPKMLATMQDLDAMLTSPVWTWIAIIFVVWFFLAFVGWLLKKH